jgi:hypothetical protein
VGKKDEDVGRNLVIQSRAEPPYISLRRFLMDVTRQPVGDEEAEDIIMAERQFVAIKP